MITSYNCTEYLLEAILSVLQQDRGEQKMQIEVVDDCSTDANVKQLVNAIGGNRVQVYRQPHNVGSLRNFETALQRANGHYVHLLHGDDKILPGYYLKMESLFNRFPGAGAAFCRNMYISGSGQILSQKQLILKEDGIATKLLEHLSTSNRLQPPAMTVRRDVYENVGGFYGVNYGEDWEMWARIAAKYEIAYTPECLAAYRIHAENVTAGKLITAECFKDVEWVLDKIGQMLPPGKRKAAGQHARKQFSTYIAAIASDNFQRNSGRYLRMAANNMRFYPSFNNLGILAYLFLRREGSRVRRLLRF